jgi:outer membrane protein assembly factor BamB
VAVARNAVILAGTEQRIEKKEGAAEEKYAVLALDLGTGKLLWRHELPAGPVGWGVAIDREGRVLVTLRDGRVLCFEQAG